MVVRQKSEGSASRLQPGPASRFRSAPAAESPRHSPGLAQHQGQFGSLGLSHEEFVLDLAGAKLPPTRPRAMVQGLLRVPERQRSGHSSLAAVRVRLASVQAEEPAVAAVVAPAGPAAVDADEPAVAVAAGEPHVVAVV